ncbi:MAG: hypothetical protein IJC48_00165 [Clostridia bacterium]|nr:hypothetical protein [Clostridia bacterium]
MGQIIRIIPDIYLLMITGPSAISKHVQEKKYSAIVSLRLMSLVKLKKVCYNQIDFISIIAKINMVKVNYMRYAFKFKLLGSKVQMFSHNEMGIVVEKEPDSVCVYGTDEKHREILCAVPLCHPKYLKGAEYIVDFDENNCAKICVGEVQIVIDFGNQKCSNNKGIKCYGSDCWGEDIWVEWGAIQ